MFKIITLIKYNIINRQTRSTYPGNVTRLFSAGAQCLKTSSEKPPLIIPGVANRTQGPGASIIERSKFVTVTKKSR